MVYPDVVGASRLTMPRIRTLKPEHRQHRKVGPLTHREYRLWVGMICEADDEGRLVAESSSLRATIFPYHADVSEADVHSDLLTLKRLGLVMLYQAAPQNGSSRHVVPLSGSSAPRSAMNRHSVTIAMFPDWRDHQRIDKPKPSRIPPPRVRDRSRKDTGSIDDKSVKSIRGSERIGKDQGSERIGKEGKGAGGETGGALLSQPKEENVSVPCGIPGHIAGCQCPAAKKARA
jgi:hypothetical protein